MYHKKEKQYQINLYFKKTNLNTDKYIVHGSNMVQKQSWHCPKNSHSIHMINQDYIDSSLENYRAVAGLKEKLGNL